MHEAEVNGNGRRIDGEQNFVGVGSLQSSARTSSELAESQQRASREPAES